MDTLSYTVEFVLWGITCAGLLLGLLLRIGEAMQHLGTWLRHRRSFRLRSPARLIPLLILGVIAGAVVILPSPAVAAQGWWWGSPINPGFDRNTVTQVTGTAAQVDIVARGGPSTLRLDTSGESFTVMLGPGWYLAEIHADIRQGDPLIVEGSKMMDRRGNLHLVVARITNQRTGVILGFRDDAGRPLWMSGRPAGPMRP